ncbi:MAG: ribonuclease Z [Candidatus Nanoarchaeia archaeon]|nr:ribonuclease Z [Candidatus Haiyanarchaeum thermophilum]MCW1302904.1 ribonuclease Z [Candidatus Haiyanarchaeum thermophilum]MCW1303583.1 ribonuclease Z [Candidatus Haiyanarchaeum thermophilum]MCW1306265.1 ribonuclease Z [Candidatus Haiyanarchaeum thermophilum]MCW1307499.1 ribonuclease Z [Candidatus Haiyanarchaeum thermophilum]
MIEIVFLGTSSMFPTKERNHTSIYLRYEGERMLFDCGEGTQRQMRIAGISGVKIKRIFISHWHGDHALGLGGIIQSLSASKRREMLEIYGPDDTQKRVKSLLNAFSFYRNFEISCHDINVADLQEIYVAERFKILAFPLLHLIPCLGFVFQENSRRKIKVEYTKKYGLVQHPIMKKLQAGEDIVWKGKLIRAEDATYIVKGKKICYIPDTKYFDKLTEYCKDADLIICEACYSKKDSELAQEYYHLTAEEAAKIAKEAGAKKLILFHFSQRYADPKVLLEEARQVFKEVELAYDFMKVELK